MSKGQLFLIVGNSGSGKDALIKEALDHWPANLPPVKIPRRYITRPPHETEPFISVTEDEFKKLKADGKFCLDWFIYDLYYGVPDEIMNWVENGDLVLVNVSRNIIPEARKKYPEMKLIFVSVPFEITQSRVKSRGRESENDPVFKERIERAKQHQEQNDADFIVDNSGALEIGATKLREYLLSYVKK